MDKTTTLLVRGASIVVMSSGLIALGLFIKPELKSINRQMYFSASKKCRASQDSSKDTYYDQTYRECMVKRG